MQREKGYRFHSTPRTRWSDVCRNPDGRRKREPRLLPATADATCWPKNHRPRKRQFFRAGARSREEVVSDSSRRKKTKTLEMEAARLRIHGAAAHRGGMTSSKTPALQNLGGPWTVVGTSRTERSSKDGRKMKRKEEKDKPTLGATFSHPPEPLELERRIRTGFSSSVGACVRAFVCAYRH